MRQSPRNQCVLERRASHGLFHCRSLSAAGNKSPSWWRPGLLGGSVPCRTVAPGCGWSLSSCSCSAWQVPCCSPCLTPLPMGSLVLCQPPGGCSAPDATFAVQAGRNKGLPQPASCRQFPLSLIGQRCRVVTPGFRGDQERKPVALPVSGRDLAWEKGSCVP